jgi:hypothetical protein
MKKHPDLFFTLFAFLFLLFLFAFIGLIVLGAAALLTTLYATPKDGLILECFASASALYVCLILFSVLLRHTRLSKRYHRFAGFYWFWAFLALIGMVFALYFVLYPRGIVSFKDGQGLYYFVGYLGFAMLAILAPSVLFIPQVKEKGASDGGSI